MEDLGIRVMSDAHLHPHGHWQGTSLGTLVTIWLAHGNQCSGNGARAAASVPGARMRSEPGAAGGAGGGEGSNGQTRAAQGLPIRLAGAPAGQEGTSEREGAQPGPGTS